MPVDVVYGSYILEECEAYRRLVGGLRASSAGVLAAAKATSDLRLAFCLLMSRQVAEGTHLVPSHDLND